MLPRVTGTRLCMIPGIVISEASKSAGMLPVFASSQAKRRFSRLLLIVVCWRELRCGCPCLACQRWEDSLGHPDLTPDRDGDRLLRTAPGGRSRPPARRDDPSAADLAALPARGHALA